MPTREQVDAALAGVQDPEIRRPITELGMVKDVRIDGGAVHVEVYLTVAGCPMREEITELFEPGLPCTGFPLVLDGINTPIM